MGHTETPWPNQPSVSCKINKGIIFQCPTPQNGGVFECLANARFIVKAVNNHDKMRDMLKDYVNHVFNPYWSKAAIHEWLEGDFLIEVQQLLAELGESSKQLERKEVSNADNRTR